MGHYLHIGGLIAVGFDATGAYLLTISHSGRGVFATADWARVARSRELAYPEQGVGIGIGPIEGQQIPVIEFYDDPVQIPDPHGRFTLECESSGIEVVEPIA